MAGPSDAATPRDATRARVATAAARVLAVGWAVALAPATPRAWRMKQGTKELLLFLACLAVAAAILAGSAARL